MSSTTKNEAIIVSDDAVRKIHELVTEENNAKLCLRVFIIGGGCSGFQYGFTFDEERQEDDFIFEKTASTDQSTVTVLVDHLSMQYLRGATIDFREDIHGAQFIINNPNAKTTCGCGSSFAMEDTEEDN